MRSRFARTSPHEDATELVRIAVARAKEGDRGAVHFLYARYADDVHDYLAGIVRDSHAAEDITQAVFETLMAAIRNYEEGGAPFEAWLPQVARNPALDRSRCLRDALKRLPPEQWHVLVLRHVVGLSPVEIAELVGRTEGSVHGLHHRGRDALEAALRELEAAPVTSSV